MTSVNLSTCIGRYCGHPPLSEDSSSWDIEKCGVCPWGYRSNKTKFCIKCEDEPIVYDWLFLGFMALLPCMLHWIYILWYENETKLLVSQVLLSSLECVVAALLALLSCEPTGSLRLVTCGVTQISDWYTMFYNPQIEYRETIHCTQEAVYPLVTIVCLYYAYTLLLMMLIRLPLLSCIAPSKKWRDPVYGALYFHPILVVVQGFVGGLLYYAFPYVTVLISLIALATFFVWTDVTKPSALFRSNPFHNFLIVFWHFLLLSFGIVAISNSSLSFLGLVPVPLAFYFMTVYFTDPENIKKEKEYGQGIDP